MTPLMQLGDDRQNQAHHVQPGPLAVTTNPQSRKHPLTLSSKKNFTSSDLKVTLHISAHFFAFRRKQPAFSELLPASGCLTFCSSFYVNRVSNNEHLRQLINGKISILLFFSMHYVHCDNFCDQKKKSLFVSIYRQNKWYIPAKELKLFFGALW